MTTEIYFIDASPFARRALIAAKEKKIKYDGKPLVPSEGQLKSPEYLKLNPRGQVPTLVDGSTIISESLAIVLYMDQKYGPYSLKSNDATVLQRMMESNNLFTSAMPVYKAKMANNGLTNDDAGFKENVDKLKVEINRWNDYIAGDFLCGNDFSGADIALVTVLYVMEHFGADFSSFTKLKAYMDKLRERPSIKETIPAGWGEPMPLLKGVL